MNMTSNVTPESIEEACGALLQSEAIVNSFTLKDGQIHRIHKKKKDYFYFPICAPLEPVGRTFDDEGGSSGLVIRFAANRQSQEIVECTVSMSELVSCPAKVVASLADKGLWVAANRDAVNKVGELLSHIQPERDLVTVSRPGWYGKTFVSPTGTAFGDQETSYRLVDGARFENPQSEGSLDDWRASTAAALECANGDFLCVGLLSGFAGTLVNLLEEPTSVLLNFAGTTSRGKTTAQRLGASIWGNPVRGGALVKFNTTPNSIEAIAEKANGSLLAIDEGGQSGMSGAQYQTAVFNLAEGSGKRRLTAAATERKVRKWSTCITISEEIGFADKVKRDGRNAAAGAVARIWEIDVDDAVILDEGTITKIDGITNNYGHAAPVFVQHLIDGGYADNPDLLRQRVKQAIAELGDEGDSPQKRRVVGAAAILLTAGELAREAGLIDDSYDLRGAVRRVLERSYARMARNMDPLEAALTKIREDIPRLIGVGFLELDYDPEQVRREIVGYYAMTDGPSHYRAESHGDTPDERVYFIPADQLQELGGGNATAAAIARELKKQNYLLTPDKKNSLFPTMPRGERIKHYRVLGSFFHERVASKIAAE